MPKSPDGPTTENRDWISKAKLELKVDRIVLQIHDASFPADPEEDLGRGSPYSNGADRLFRFARELGFDAVQLGPRGMIGRGNPSPYEGTIFSRNPLDLPLLSLVEQGRINRGTFDELKGSLPLGQSGPVPYPLVFDAYQVAISELIAKSTKSDRTAAKEFLDANQWWIVPDAIYSALSTEFGSESWRDRGIVAPVYSLRSERNLGHGDLADLQALWRWNEPIGGRIIATLSLMAIHLQEPFDPSHYAPLSRTAWNEMYLAIDQVLEFATCTAAHQLVASQDFRDELKQHLDSSLIDYRRQCTLRRGILEHLAERCFAHRGPRWKAVQQAIQDEPQLEHYARFRAVWERRGQPWPRWPDRQCRGEITSNDYDQAVLEYHLYAQWATRVQIKELGDEIHNAGSALHLDYPVGVHRHGYDAWRHAELFVDGVAIGAPLDGVFTNGQDWGLAPLHPDRMRACGYRYFIDSLPCQMRHAGALRIDHVMRLLRQFWIPVGMPASEGVYMRYPTDEWYAILCLESQRHRARLSGENLGTVPPAVSRALKRHRISGTYVAQYELAPHSEDPLSKPPELSVSSVNTHDMPTFAAYWQGLDLDGLFDLGLFDECGITRERQRRAAIGDALLAYLRREGLLADEPSAASIEGMRHALPQWLALSQAESLLIGLEDVWLDVLPQNIPDTTNEFPNWQRKNWHSIETISTQPEWNQLLSHVHRARKESAVAIPVALANPTPSTV